MNTPAEQSDPAALIESTVFQLLTAGAEYWARVDLTMPQLKVLLLLGQHGSAPVSWLAARMAVSPPNITGILDRLEQRGWVERTSDSQDRRVVRILLTDGGTKLLHELAGAGVSHLRECIGSLGDRPAESLRHGLSAFLESMAEQDASTRKSLIDGRKRELRRTLLGQSVQVSSAE
jgi:DNA-binding MarR family transcriptional regulator